MNEHETSEGEVFANLDTTREVIGGFQSAEAVLAVENTNEVGGESQNLHAAPRRRISHLEDAEDWSINQSTGNYFGEGKKITNRIGWGFLGSVALVGLGLVMSGPGSIPLGIMGIIYYGLVTYLTWLGAYAIDKALNLRVISKLLKRFNLDS